MQGGLLWMAPHNSAARPADARPTKFGWGGGGGTSTESASVDALRRPSSPRYAHAALPVNAYAWPPAV